MATRNFTQDSFTSDATYRTHITAIHDALIAAGWLQTADTGQINFTTVAKPTAAAQTAGYAVYRMDDALQTSYPVYLKITFKSATSANASGNGLGLRFDVGFATNGAGTLTGNTAGEQGNWYSTNAAPGTAVACYSAGSTSWFSMALLPSVAGYGHFFSIERSKDSSGADTSDGVAMIVGGPAIGTAASGGNAPWSAVYVPRSGSVPAAELPPLMTPLNSSSSASLGADVAVFPWYPVNGLLLPPALGAMAYMVNDIASLSTISVTRYGAAHTYLALGLLGPAYAAGGPRLDSTVFCRCATYSNALPGSGAKTNVGLLMRWE